MEIEAEVIEIPETLETVVDLMWELGVLETDEQAEMVRELLDMGSRRLTVEKAAKKMGVSRRTLHRRTNRLKIPNPGALLRLGTLAIAVKMLQEDPELTLKEVAAHFRVDMFWMSSAVDRFLAMRPTAARKTTMKEAVRGFLIRYWPDYQVDEVRCPAGHLGPFRYVEKIECWRSVKGLEDGKLVVHGEYHTEGYDEGVGDGELECRHEGRGETCMERFPVPLTVEIEWA